MTQTISSLSTYLLKGFVATIYIPDTINIRAKTSYLENLTSTKT